MDDGTLLNQMEELAGRLGIEIRYGNIPGEDSHRTGGLCRVRYPKKAGNNFRVKEVKKCPKRE